MFLSLCWASVERKRSAKTADELLANESWTFFVVPLSARLEPGMQVPCMILSFLISSLSTTFSMLGMDVCVLEHKYHSYRWCLRVCIAGDFPVGLVGLVTLAKGEKRNVTRRESAWSCVLLSHECLSDVTSVGQKLISERVEQRTHVQLDMHVCATLLVLTQQLESTRFAPHMII